MESKKKVKRKCPVCNTTKIKRSEDYGLVCKYGHKILGVQKEEAEDEGLASTTTKRKRNRDTVEEEFITVSARKSAFIRMMQFALMVLSRQMVQDLGFPADLEYAVREFWLVAMSALNIELDNSYIIEMKEKEINQVKLGMTSAQDNPEQLLSDQDEDNEDDDDDDDNFAQREDQKDIKLGKSEQLRYMDVLTIIFIACIYLRLPVLPGDMIRWCKSNVLHYTSIQNRVPEDWIKLLPLSITNTMVVIPEVNALSARAIRLAKRLYLPQNTIIPDYNIPLYLNRFCSQFYLPVEGFYIALYLFKKHQLPCKLSMSYENEKVNDTLKRLMACVVCVTKLFYSLDHSKNSQNNSVVYNVNTTRGEWIELIKENYKTWEKAFQAGPENDTALSIKMVDDDLKTNVTIKANKSRNVLLKGFLNNISSRSKNSPAVQQNIDNPFLNPPDKNTANITKNDQKVHVQPEGRFYYMYKFGLRPSDYELVIKLASLIVGEHSMTGLERLVMELDRKMKSEEPNQIEMSGRYPLYREALKNLYGTKFYHGSFK